VLPLRSTPRATLPTVMLRRPVRPCVASTIRSVTRSAFMVQHVVRWLGDGNEHQLAGRPKKIEG
jgi:hypothetical protein